MSKYFRVKNGFRIQTIHSYIFMQSNESFENSLKFSTSLWNVENRFQAFNIEEDFVSIDFYSTHVVAFDISNPESLGKKIDGILEEFIEFSIRFVERNCFKCSSNITAFNQLPQLSPAIYTLKSKASIILRIVYCLLILPNAFLHRKCQLRIPFQSKVHETNSKMETVITSTMFD